MAGRKLPHDLEAERRALGCVLLHPAQVIELQDLLRPEALYAPQHQDIYQAILDLVKDGKPLDLTLLKSHLEAAGRLGRVGGVEYLAELTNEARPVNLPHYVGIINRSASLRNVIHVCGETSSRAYTEEEEPGILVHDGIRSLEECDVDVAAGQHISELCEQIGDDVKKGLEGNNESAGVPTGITRLDARLAYGGLTTGGLTIVGGGTSSGKSSFSTAISRGVAVTGGGVLDFSLEDKTISRVRRLVSAVSGIPNERVQQNTIEEGTEYDSFNDALAELEGYGIWYAPRKVRKVKDICSFARKHTRRYETKVVIIDYLQLVRADTNFRSEQDRINHALEHIVDFSSEFSGATLLLSQFSREGYKDPTVCPRINHLYHSGAIEQEADTILLLWRPPTESKKCCNVVLAKQKQGIGVGSSDNRVVLGWDGPLCAFGDAYQGDVDEYEMEMTAFKGH